MSIPNHWDLKQNRLLLKQSEIKQSGSATPCRGPFLRSSYAAISANIHSQSLDLETEAVQTGTEPFFMESLLL